MTMNTAVSSPGVGSHSHVLGWLANVVSGVRWGLEMRRRYEAEVAAGRRPDGETMQRIAGEIDAWLEGQS